MPTVETNGVETYYERHGTGYPLVFIHGAGWDHRQWTPQIETLVEDYEVICYDVRGHGKTGGSNQDDISFETYSEDLKALIDALSLKRPVFVGLSMGGRIAHRCAASYPETPGALVTYEAPVRLEPLSLPLPARVLRRIHREVIRFLGSYRAYQLFSWYQRYRGDTEKTGTESTPVLGLEMSKEEYIRDAIERSDRRERLKFHRSFGDTIDTPSSVTVPTLVLTGDGPDSFNHEAADILSEEIPDARRETLPNAGHAGNIDDPEAFNDAIESFIAETIETAPSTV